MTVEQCTRCPTRPPSARRVAAASSALNEIISIAASKRCAPRVAAKAAWSRRSPRSSRTSGGGGSTRWPRLNRVTSWPFRSSAWTIARLIVPVPPMINTCMAASTVLHVLLANPHGTPCLRLHDQDLARLRRRDRRGDGGAQGRGVRRADDDRHAGDAQVEAGRGDGALYDPGRL